MQQQQQSVQKVVIIRKAMETELDKLVELNKYLFNLSRTEFDATMNEKWPDSEAGTSYFKKMFEAGENGLVLVAEDQGTFVGYLAGKVSDMPSYRVKEGFAELTDMMLKPEYQGKGVGTKLVSTFKEWCTGKDIQRIAVSVFAKNLRAIEFYKKMGFLPYDITMEMSITNEQK